MKIPAVQWKYILKFNVVINVVRERRQKMPKHGTNIRKRTDGRWEGRYKVFQDDNSCKYRSVYGKTCSEVKEKLQMKLKEQEGINRQIQSVSEIKTGGTANAVTDVCREEAAVINRESMQDFTSVSVKWLESIKETRKYSTYIKYRGLYERHIKDRIGNTAIRDISYSLVNERIFRQNDKIQYSQNLKHSILAVINQILKYAAENYGCPKIQLTNKPGHIGGKRAEIMNHTEQALLLRYLHQEMDASKAGILLCIYTGLRLGEICSLKWSDIDFEQMIIHVRRTVQRVAIDGDCSRTALLITEPKSAFSVREIPISRGTVQILHKIRHEEEYVVGGKAPLEPRTYQNRFKRYLKDIAIREYNFHALRHTFATNCIDHDMDVKSLSEILGHANIQITLNKYVHPTMDTKRRQLAILDSVYGQFCGNYG